MNPTKHRNPGRAARAFAAMALAAASFLVPGAAHAADEATVGPATADAVATDAATDSTETDAATTDAATASSLSRLSDPERLFVD